MATLQEAEKAARNAVNAWSAGATAVSWVPGSSYVLGAADYLMVKQVALAFDVEEYDTVAAIGPAAGGVLGRIAVEALSLVPVAGWLGKAIIAGTITKAIGESVIAYFRERSPLH